MRPESEGQEGAIKKPRFDFSGTVFTAIISVIVSFILTTILNQIDYFGIFPKSINTFSFIGSLLFLFALVFVMILTFNPKLRYQFHLWGITIFILIISIFIIIIPLYQDFATSPLKANSPYRITKSIIDISVYKNGAAIFKRTQYLQPLQPFTTTTERPFWSTGPLNDDSFRMYVVAPDQQAKDPMFPDTANCDVSYDTSQKFVLIDHCRDAADHTVLKDPYIYKRITEVYFDSAYIDPDSDFVHINVPVETDTAIIHIELMEGVKWDKTSFKVNRVKTCGGIENLPFPSLKHLLGDSFSDNNINLLLLSPCVGNVYEFKWNYQPNHSPDPNSPSTVPESL